MKRALIEPRACQNCQPCAVEANCMMEAVFREDPSEKPWMDFYRCSGCLKCRSHCPHQAIQEIAHPCDGKGRMGW